MTLQAKANKLLRKKKVTGHDVGALLLDSFRATIVPDESQIKAENFAELENRLISEKDKKTYDMFKNIYFQLIALYGKTVEQLKSFTSRLDADKILKEFISYEEIHATTEKYPVILSSETYAEMITRAKAAIKNNPEQTLFLILQYFRIWDEMLPDTKLKSVIKKYKKMSPALNKRCGEDGTPFRSAFYCPIYQLNGETLGSLQDPRFIEAKKARALEVIGSEDLDAYDTYIADKKKELLYKGPAAIRDYMEEASGTRLTTLKDNALLKALESSIKLDIVREYLSPEYITLENALHLNPVVEYCGTQPDKYQEGYSYFDLIHLYTSLNPKDPVEKDLTAKIKEDYPVLATAIDDYLEKEIAEDFPTLPDYYIALLSDLFKNSPNTLEHINTGGIAVNRKPYPNQKHKAVYPKFDVITHPGKDNTPLEAFSPLAFMNCYNTTITLLAEVFDVPELLEFALLSVPQWEEYSNAFNKILFSIYYDLSMYYTDDKLEERRQALRGLFPYGYLRSASELEPSIEAINKVKKELTYLRDTADPGGNLRLIEYFFVDSLMDSVKL